MFFEKLIKATKAVFSRYLDIDLKEYRKKRDGPDAENLMIRCPGKGLNFMLETIVDPETRKRIPNPNLRDRKIRGKYYLDDQTGEVFYRGKRFSRGAPKSLLDKLQEDTVSGQKVWSVAMETNVDDYRTLEVYEDFEGITYWRANMYQERSEIFSANKGVLRANHVQNILQKRANAKGKELSSIENIALKIEGLYWALEGHEEISKDNISIASHDLQKIELDLLSYRAALRDLSEHTKRVKTLDGNINYFYKKGDVIRKVAKEETDALSQKVEEGLEHIRQTRDKLQTFHKPLDNGVDAMSLLPVGGFYLGDEEEDTKPITITPDNEVAKHTSSQDGIEVQYTLPSQPDQRELSEPTMEVEVMELSDQGAQERPKVPAMELTVPLSRPPKEADSTIDSATKTIAIPRRKSRVENYYRIPSGVEVVTFDATLEKLSATPMWLRMMIQNKRILPVREGPEILFRKADVGEYTHSPEAKVNYPEWFSQKDIDTIPALQHLRVYKS